MGWLSKIFSSASSLRNIVFKYGIVIVVGLLVADLGVASAIILHAHGYQKSQIPSQTPAKFAQSTSSPTPKPTGNIIFPTLPANGADKALNESATPTPTPVEGEIGVVARVVDGDTIELTTGQKVRYIGIDTPETVDPRKPVQCFGEQASAENNALVAGKTVTLVKDISETDKYGRLLRYVYVGHELVNEYLIRNGYARLLTIPPDVAMADTFRADQQLAQQERLGLWSAC